MKNKDVSHNQQKLTIGLISLLSLLLILIGCGGGGGGGGGTTPAPNPAPLPESLELVVQSVDTTLCPVVTVKIKASRVVDTTPLGLTVGQVSVLESSVAQTVTSVVSATTATSVAIAMDYSGSMDDAELNEMESAVLAFIALMRVNDQAEIIKFRKTPSVIQTLTNNGADLSAAVTTAVDRTPATDGTALLDAVYQGVTDVAGEAGAAVILVTDGQDFDSTRTLPETIAHAVANNVPVYTIGVNANNTADLTQLAEDTGGLFLSAPLAANLETIYEALAEILLNEFIVSYTSAVTGATNETIEVELNVGGLVSDLKSIQFTSCP